MTAATASRTLGQDARLLGLIGTGHFASHFYGLTLPPLFPLLHVEFGASYTMLGLVMTLFAGASGLVQVPVGFLVDRVGAKPVLVAGLVLEALAIGAMALVPSIGGLLVLAAVAGAGNCVFHPANYAILNATFSEHRIGRAFSLHTMAGHLGTAVAPMTVIAVTALWDWRTALMALGAMGLVVAALLAMGRDLSAAETAPEAAGEEAKGEPAAAAPDSVGAGIRLLLSAPMLAFFLFFAATAMTSNGIRTFSVVALNAIFETPLALAGTALTGFLFASATGILIGGALADRTSRHDLMAALAFVVSAVVIVLVGSVSLPGVALITLMVLAGLSQGIVRPARDMMVRAAAPKGSAGKVFGFVSSGIAVGGALSPILFGWIIDQGDARWVFWLLAAITVLALGTLMVPAGSRR